MRTNARHEWLTFLRKKRWTDAQIELLIESLVYRTTISELVQRTGRTEYAVGQALAYLKDATALLLKPRMFQAGQPWTRAEENALMAHFFFGASLTELVAQSGRTSNAVLGRLQRMNLVVLMGDTYHRCEGKQIVSLGYTWSDHTRLDIESYGNPWHNDEPVSGGAPLSRLDVIFQEWCRK